MKKIFWTLTACLIFMACNNEKKEETKTGDETKTTTGGNDQPPQSEMADAKYADWGKKLLDQMSAGNIDAWGDAYADSAKYVWSSGDSLTGKAAILSYWKDRRSNTIDSISFVNDIWLPIKVNRPQKGPDATGIWLLSWYQVMVKYKNGAKLGFWVHTDHHFNADDKIERTIQYIDRVPINKALGVK